MDSDVCASTPHPWLSLFVYRCDHGLGHVAALSYGPDSSTADHDAQYATMIFGPLTDDHQVVMEIWSAVERLLP